MLEKWAQLNAHRSRNREGFDSLAVWRFKADCL